MSADAWPGHCTDPTLLYGIVKEWNAWNCLLNHLLWLLIGFPVKKCVTIVSVNWVCFLLQVRACGDSYLQQRNLYLFMNNWTLYCTLFKKVFLKSISQVQIGIDVRILRFNKKFLWIRECYFFFTKINKDKLWQSSEGVWRLHCTCPSDGYYRGIDIARNLS